jgi:hypothetical protein
VFLCEISYAERLGSLVERLRAWTVHWPGVCAALVRDCKVPNGWPVRPWLFVPEQLVSGLIAKLDHMTGADGSAAFKPRITPLESVQPWHYRSWNHCDGETEKPNVPEAMRS